VENTIDTPELNLSALASSGLPVSFEIIYGPAIVVGDKLVFTGGSGEILVTARQSGNETFGAAIPEPVIFHAADPIQAFENLYILGDATPVGWNIGSPALMTQNEADPYIWEWEGELSTGEFKMPTFTGDWCDGVWINASQPNQVLTATDYIFTYGCDGPDNKWRVNAEDAGPYRIVVEVEKETILIRPVNEPDYENIYVLGDATPVGWNINSPIPMVRDESNPFLFTVEVFLTPGELKFPTFTGDWCDGDWINASQANQSISATDFIITSGCDGPDNKWKVNEGDVDNYLITIDLENESLSINPAVSSGSILAEQQAEYTVFPNPASDLLNINFSRESSALIRLYSATGGILYQEEVNGIRTSIDLSGLHTYGLLLLKISTDTSSEVVKVVVQ